MQKTLALIEAEGGAAFPVKANLDGSFPTIETLFRSLIAAPHSGCDTIDILVNNAAICLRGPIEETTEEIFDGSSTSTSRRPFSW